MGVKSTFYTVDGTTKKYPSTMHIGSKQHVAVWLLNIDSGVYEQLPINSFELIYNSVVLTNAPSPSLYSQLEVRVADEPDELGTTQSDVAIVASIASEIVNVSNTSDDIIKVNTYTDNIKTVSNDINFVNITAQNISDIITASDNIDEIKSADDNARIATEKALESSVNADITNVNVVITNADVVTTNADVVITNADVVTTNLNVETTNALVTMANNAANSASNHAQDAANIAESIDDTAYALTQVGINLSTVVDGDLIMQFNDPVTNISLNSDNELVIEY